MVKTTNDCFRHELVVSNSQTNEKTCCQCTGYVLFGATLYHENYEMYLINVLFYIKIRYFPSNEDRELSSSE